MLLRKGSGQKRKIYCFAYVPVLTAAFLLLLPTEGKRSVTKPWTGTWKLKEYAAPCNLPLTFLCKNCPNSDKLLISESSLPYKHIWEFISIILTNLLTTDIISSRLQGLSWACNEVTPPFSRAEKMERVFYILSTLHVNTKTAWKGGENNGKNVEGSNTTHTGEKQDGIRKLSIGII